MSRLRCAVVMVLAGAARAAEVALIRTLWGVERFDHVEQWPALFQDLAKSNYSGVEAPTWVVCGVSPTFVRDHDCDKSRSTAFRAALRASGLMYIAQVHTCGYPIAFAEPSYHLASMHEQLILAKEQLGADRANVYGGVDFWSPADLHAFFQGAKRLQETEFSGMTISHETHRMRTLATPMAASFVLDAVPGVRLTADLSHWVVGAERLLDFPSDASWWPKLL
jgi:sugar phosphate isomerase/epimerase